MRKLAFLAPLGFALAMAASAQAQTASVTVAIGPELQRDPDSLGDREVREQADRLAAVVVRALDRRDALEGARINLVLTDLKPNRPTFQQMAHRPGLDGQRSVSIGGAFFGESMFSREPQASKVALTHLQWRLKERGFLMHDTQWTTPHLAMFGGHEISCAQYLELLHRSIRRKVTFM